VDVRYGRTRVRACCHVWRTRRTTRAWAMPCAAWLPTPRATPI
jgi:hypothetical protein